MHGNLWATGSLVSLDWLSVACEAAVFDSTEEERFWKPRRSVRRIEKN